MMIELRMRKPLVEIVDILVPKNIFVKVYETNYSVNIKIYQKHPHGTELFVNVDINRDQIAGISNDFNTAVCEYIKENVHVTMGYQEGETKYFVALRNIKLK